MRSFAALLILVSLLLLPFVGFGCNSDSGGSTEESEPAAAALELDAEPAGGAPGTAEGVDAAP